MAVAFTSHVGSAREKKGRTGFAHIGGSGANGSTSRDRTNYFQTVPGFGEPVFLNPETEGK